MKYIKFIKLFLLLIIVSVVFLQCNNASDSAVSNKLVSTDSSAQQTDTSLVSLPFTITFAIRKYNPSLPPLPKLQSYAVSMWKQYLIVSGGRRQGLHTFQQAPAQNFIPDSANNYIYLINPSTGVFTSFNVNTLPANLSAPLQATNQQSYYDASTDYFYIIGGYGWDPQKNNMVTFNTIMRYKVDSMGNALASNPTPAKIASLIQISTDDRFAVTGGELYKMGPQFYLVFGQRFDGQYRAFGGDSSFTQKYTEEVRVFTLKPNSLQILSYGATTNSEKDQPFHRRDGNTIPDIDPATGTPRITAFGGVFTPGIIGAYTYPVYITGPGTPTLNRNASQKFSQYECPVVSLYDSVRKTISHNFFGGISHYYYSQVDSQIIVYNIATQEGRNDGFPFIADVSTYVQKADGSYSEYIQLKHTTASNRLLGASIPFIINRNLINSGQAYSNGVIKLSRLSPTTPTSVGYIYGGIEAQNPLPLYPNTGTFVSNTVFEVYVSPTSSQVRPASAGHESTKDNRNLKRE